MSLRKILLLSSMIVAVGVAGYWGGSTLLHGNAGICQVCSRPIHEGEEFTLILDDGTRERACCPRCGMHFQLTHVQEVRGARATDYVSGEKIDPQQATYVEGSDMVTCCSTPPVKRGRESSYELVWDRCLPTLIAFASNEDARKFKQQHGGRLLTFPEMVESVKQH